MPPSVAKTDSIKKQNDKKLIDIVPFKTLIFIILNFKIELLDFPKKRNIFFQTKCLL